MARKKDTQVAEVSKLQIIRVSRGLTQLELAKKCGIDNSTLSLYETGRRRPRLDNAVKLSKVLQCPVEDIIGFVKPPEIAFLTPDNVGVGK